MKSVIIYLLTIMRKWEVAIPFSFSFEVIKMSECRVPQDSALITPNLKELFSIIVC